MLQQMWLPSSVQPDSGRLHGGELLPYESFPLRLPLSQQTSNAACAILPFLEARYQWDNGNVEPTYHHCAP